MIRRDDELLERYQRAVVASRALHAQASSARKSGEIDYLAEGEAVFNDGQVAAYGWLLGVTPVTPLLSAAAAVDAEGIRAEFQAAEAAKALGAARFDERLAEHGHAYDVDTDASYADGVASALAWELTRSGAPTY